MSLRKGKPLFICFIYVFLFIASPSYAQVGLSVGTEYGLGLAAQVGTEAAQLEVAGGLLPLLFFAIVTFDDDILELFFPWTIGAKIIVRPNSWDEDNRIGIKFGLSYNTLLKTGFGGGVNYQMSKKPKVIASVGIMIYLKAKDELRKKINEDKGKNFSDDEFSAPLSFFQPFVSVSIFWGK